MDWSKRHFWSYQETFLVSIIKLNLQFSLNLMQEIYYAANLSEIFAIVTAQLNLNWSWCLT